MPLVEWIKLRMYILLGCLVLLPSPTCTARPRFDTSTDMGLVLVPADAEIDSVIFRLRATDQDADFPLIFDITATVTPIVRIENLPCTLYNKVCQANVILTKRLVPGRLHDFAVRVKDSKGDSNSMQATISVTNSTTQRDKIFPHIPAIIMVPEDTKPGKELDYVLVRSNQWSGKPVYIELWQPKELFTIRQRQTPAETRGVITLIGELDFETQSMYTLKMYATDPYTEPKKDTRNIAGLHLVVIVQDVQDVPPIFTLAPPLTKINNTVQPGDIILRVHAEDGDKGVPREVTYGLVSEGNPFTPFFNISETTGEITLARSLEELTQITHVGAPVVLSIVAEEIRRSTSEPPAQATVVEVGLLLGEPGNSPPFFENDNYVAWMDENAQPGSVVIFTEHYSTKVRDEDIGKAGVFALKLYNNNGTFEISPAVAERTANFIITVRDNSLIDYEMYKSLRFEIIAQEVGPATNLSANVPATIFIRDVNDNPPEFESASYEVTLSEDVTAGTRVVQVHATDKDTGSFGRIQYTRIIGPGNEGFVIDPNTGIITVSMENSVLDREITPSFQLSVEATDEDGKGLRGIVPLIVNLLDVNDNAPIFEKESYEFTLNEDSTNFTMPAIIKAFDADAEPPNNEIRYELVHGNYENKFYLNEITGELFLREPINKVRRTRHNPYQNFATKVRNGFTKVQKTFENMLPPTSIEPEVSSENSTSNNSNKTENITSEIRETLIIRKKREDDDVIFTLTARAYDLGVPHLSGVTRISVMKGAVAGARIVSFVVPGENPDPEKTAETLAAITGGRITVQEIRPYTINDVPNNGSGSNVPSLDGEKKSIVVARVEPNSGGTSFVDIERIRAALAANGVGVIGGGMSGMETGSEPKSMDDDTMSHSTNTNTITNITSIHNEEVTVYKAENRLLFWLLIILGLLMLLALIALIICCICPGCPFYMAPRKRRVHSSETLIARSDGRPKRHLHRKHARLLEASWPGRKQAWSADPMRRNWQFNRRNQKAGGLASLPGDVHVIDREHEILEKTGSLRLRDGPVMMYSTEQIRRPEEERIYIEDVEGMRARGYVEIDSLRQHDLERGLEMPHQSYINQDEQRAHEQSKFIREQHFYRDGNAEILRLVTRGQIEEGILTHPVQRPQTLVMEQGQSGAYRNDGKEILLQRFIEDQKHRHATSGQDLHDSFQDIERRSMESHQRQKDATNVQDQQQTKILLLPERLEEDHRQHIEELGPDVQRLIIDHGSFEKAARFEPKGSEELIPGATLVVHAPITKVSNEKPKEETSRQNVNLQHYSIHDLELARQNALLTRLLLERDGREAGGGAMVDSASYLETQSLPGQVAIATQTDRTAATQTELPSRSRSDNDESEEEARMRKKLKSKKRYTDAEPRRIRTLWVKSPIEEEELQYETEKKTNFLRRKIRDVKESRRISLEPDVLKEISDSLDENGDPPITARRREQREDSNSKEESRNGDESGRLEDSSSTELVLRDGRRNVPEKREARGGGDEEAKRKSHREKRENVDEPSFRILEKEMSALSKKLSKLAAKKILQYSNGSETDSHETVKTAATTNTKKNDKKMEIAEMKKVAKEAETTKKKRSKSTPRTTVLETPLIKEQTKIHDEIIDGKTRQTLKYRKGQNISTGSSDFEETVEKLKKSIPLVKHAEKQRQVPAKSSCVKLKRHSRLELNEMAKPSLAAPPQETGEVKDSSDTASKGSIRSYKNERDSMGMKRYTSVMVEEQSGLASGSPSSDNSKDKKPQKKERPILEKKSVVETSEEKTDSEQPSASRGSDNLKDKKSKRKDRPILEKKSIVKNSEEKTDSELASGSPSSDNLKDKRPKRKETPMLGMKSPIKSSKGKTESEQADNSPNLDNMKDKVAQWEEKPIQNRKSAIERSEGKSEFEQTIDAPHSDNLKDTRDQRKEGPILERKSAADRSEGKTKSKLVSDSPNSDNLENQTPQKEERLILDRKIAVETNKEKTESEPASDGSDLDNLKDKSPQRKERIILDRKSAVDASEEKTKSEPASDGSNSDKLKDKTHERTEKPILDIQSAAEASEQKTEFKLMSDDANLDNSQDRTSPENIRPVLDRKSAIDVSEVKTESELSSDGSNLDNLEDKKLERKESTLDRKSAEKASEQKTESKPAGGPDSDILQDKTPQNEKLILDMKTGVIASETVSQVSQEETTRESPAQTDEKSSVEATVTEIKRESSEISELKLNIIPVTGEMQESKTPERQFEKVIDVAAAAQKSDDSKQEESFDAIKHEVVTIPKEEIVDFLAHEAKDSMQALQGHYYSIIEGAEKVKDIVLGSVMMKHVDEGSPGISDKETIPEPVKLKSSDDFKESDEVPKDTSEAEQEIEKEKKVPQQSEDGGTFSDNFDSFCGTDILVKDSLDSQGSKDEIAYEILQSEPSEEQISPGKIPYVKDDIDNSKKVATADEPTKKSGSPQIVTIEKTPEPQNSTSITASPSRSADESADLSPKRAVSRGPTPVSDELVTTERPEMTPDDSTHTLETKLDAAVPTEEPTDALKDTTERTKSPEIEQSDFKTIEEKLNQVPIVPPLDIQSLDDKMTSIEEPSEQTHKMMSPKFSSQSPEKITLETPSQKEFGIADSLFVDAKVLETLPSPKQEVTGINIELPQGEMLGKEKINIDVAPINLIELSRAMLEDADDSDSSEASSKTMLTARPYGTPRHRPISGSEVIKPAEVSLVSIETAPVTVQVRESVHSSEKIGKEASPDENTEQIVLEPGLQTEAEPDTSGRIAEETISVKIEPSPEFLPVKISSEISKKDPETPIQIGAEGIEKLKMAAQQEDVKGEATEKVQLYQIRQKTLSADPDGFDSLPETGYPVKSFNDTTLPEEAPLSEETKKLSEEAMTQDVEERVVKASNPDADESVSLPKTSETEKSLVDMTLPEETSLPEEMKGIPVVITTGDVEEHVIKSLGDRARIMPHAKKETKGILKKKDTSKDDLSKGPRKVIAASTKTEPPKKERKVKTLKDESAKIAKQNAVVGQITSSRDSKRKVRPAEPRAEEQADRSPGPDRIGRTSKKTEYFDKDVNKKDKTKVEKVKKISIPHGVDGEKSVGKRPTKIHAKREKLNGSRAKKIPEKSKKMDSTKIIPLRKVEKVVHEEKIVHQEIVKDLKDQDRRDAAESFLLVKDETKILPIVETEESMPPSLVAKSEEVEGDQKNIEEKLSSETPMVSPKNTELTVDTRLEAPRSKEESIEIETAKNLPVDTGKVDSAMTDEKIKSAVVSEPTKILEETGAIQMITHQPETNKEAIQEEDEDKTRDSSNDKSLKITITTEKPLSPRKTGKHRKETDMVVIESQSRYMEWYKLKREEMERKRQDRKNGDEEEVRPKWLRKSTRQRWIKVGPEDRFDSKMPEMTPSRRRKIKPLVNVESEQLKAIVRQGRKLRRAQGEKADEPQIQIFAPEKPPTPLSSIPINSRYHHHHHLVQHSEYKYEKIPLPSFYLHPQPVLNPTPQMSPQNFDDLCPEQQYSSLPTASRCPDESCDSGIIHQQQQGSNKLRHGELLEKKSVFDIAYSEAAPSQLRSDSTTPPS